MGSNPHGFDNEKKICQELKGDLGDLGPNLKNFVKYVAKTKSLPVGESTSVNSSHIEDNECKSDLELEVSGQNFGVSVKSGSANSVHQERIEDFTEFIKKSRKIEGTTDKIIEYFEWFINSKDYAKELQKRHPDRIEELKNFVSGNKRVLAKRFVKTGLVDYHHADFIYYGTPEEGLWAGADEAIDKAISRDNPWANLPVGSLTIQAWNRTNEQKRYVLQVKWGRLEKDLKEAKNE